MGKIKVAVIGCGNIGTSAHIPGYTRNPDAEIIYFCDILPERAEAAAKAAGSGKAVTDYREVLADPEVQAVSVCTPNHKHAEITIAALEKGKDVLCEKPAARTFAEAKSMLEAKRRTGRLLQIGVVNRFNTGVNKIKQLIDEGALGDVYHVYVSFRAHRSIPGLGGDFTTKAIAGGGALIDWGVHFLDIVMYCAGDPAARTVSAETFSKLGVNMDEYVYVNMWAQIGKKGGTYDVDDSLTALVRTDGPVLTVHGAWAQNIGEGEMFIDFMGDKGGIRLMYGSDFTLWTTHNGMLTKTTYQFKPSNHFDNEINAFLESIGNRKENAASIENAVLTSELMQAMYDSAQQHRELVL